MAFVQTLSDQSFNGVATTVHTLAANGTAGNVAALAVTSAGGFYPTSATDTKGNVWVVGTRTTSSRTVGVLTAVMAKALVTGDTISVVWSGVMANGAGLSCEYSGLKPVAPLDAAVSTTGTSVTSLASGSSGALTQADELELAAVGVATNVALTAPSGLTARTSSAAATTSCSLAFADIDVSVTAAVNPSWSWTGAANASAAVLTLRHIGRVHSNFGPRVGSATRPAAFQPGLAR